MKGSIKWQVTEIFKEIKEIGNSKHEAKNHARLAGARGSHQIAQKTGIYGIDTMDDYRSTVVGFATWAKENLHLKDLTKTNTADVKAYLDNRIKTGKKHKTFQLDKSALNKFELALNRYSQNHNLNKTYDFGLNETFKDAHKSLVHADVKAYKQKDIDKILNTKDKAVNLACRIALFAGLRKSEILNLGLKPESLKENNAINVIGGKGGKDRTVSAIANKSLIDEIKIFLHENNLRKFGDAVTGGKINNAIRKVLVDTGSIHALRHNFAINTIKYFEGLGYSHIEAVHLTSLQLGHNRNEIIEGVYSK